MEEFMDVMVETTDGTVTNVFSTHDCNVLFVERNQMNENSTDYRSNLCGSPGMVTATYELEASPDMDIHSAWLCAMDEGVCCMDSGADECDVIIPEVGDDEI